MNRTIKDATVKRYFYETHDQLRAHLQNFVDVYNFARRLKTLRGLTPYEFISKAWTSEPHRFKISPLQQMPRLNIWLDPRSSRWRRRARPSPNDPEPTRITAHGASCSWRLRTLSWRSPSVPSWSGRSAKGRLVRSPSRIGMTAICAFRPITARLSRGSRSAN
jgi:hypothetical protein